MGNANESEPAKSSNLLPIRELHPAGRIPTIYSDGVSSAQNGPEVVRFYLSRFDPAMDGNGPFQNEPVAQIVMPLSSFVQSVSFLQDMVERLEKGGMLTPEMKVAFLRRVDS